MAQFDVRCDYVIEFELDYSLLRNFSEFEYKYFCIPLLFFYFVYVILKLSIAWLEIEEETGA